MAYHSTYSDELEGSRRRDDDGYSRYSGSRDLYPEAHPQGGSYRQQAAAPVYSPPSDKPPIPVGWVPQWDDRYQRWFYHDTASGHSQWEAPGYVPSREIGGYQDNEGEYRDGEKQKSGSGHGGMLLGAAGGLAAGALLSNALHDDSDDESRSYPGGAPIQQAAYAGSVSSSDRESLDEARRDYAEARDDARSSSASSSDREREEEAREEYYSEQEEAYGSD